VHWAFEEATSLYDDVDGLELTYPHLRKLVHAARELLSHIANGWVGLINYGERFRSGERISAAMAESTVDVVASKRFAKRQPGPGPRRGAPLRLETRPRALVSEPRQQQCRRGVSAPQNFMVPRPGTRNVGSCPIGDCG
jgi:hypothetical protein